MYKMSDGDFRHKESRTAGKWGGGGSNQSTQPIQQPVAGGIKS